MDLCDSVCHRGMFADSVNMDKCFTYSSNTLGVTKTRLWCCVINRQLMDGCRSLESILDYEKKADYQGVAKVLGWVWTKIQHIDTQGSY